MAESPKAEPASDRARAQRPREVLWRCHHPHPFAAAAGHRLQHQRIPDARGNAQDVGVGHVLVERLVGPGHDGDTGAHRRLPRRGLAAHQGDRFRRWSDEGEAGVTTRGGKVLVLGQEPVARMHRVGARLARRVDDGVDPQVALARRIGPDRPRFVGHPDVQGATVAVGVHRHGRDAHIATGPDDADRDFATVRDEDLFHWENPVIVTGAAEAARPTAGYSRASSAGSCRACGPAWRGPESACGGSRAAGSPRR